MDIALVQQFQPDDSREAFQEGLDLIRDAAEARADLVLFPELSFTSYYPRMSVEEREQTASDLAEPVPSPTTEAVAEVAEELGVVVVFNMLERDNDETYSTSLVIEADGSVLGGTRAMHVPTHEHLFEEEYYTPGDTGAPVYDTSVGRIGIASGYDRHYPEYLRTLASNDAELVVVPQARATAEPSDGIHEAEMRVSSFQNGFYTAMANRVGQEQDLLFDGRSVVTDPSGRVVAEAPSGNSIILLASVDFDECDHSPAQQLFLRARRSGEYENGAVSDGTSSPMHQNALEDWEGAEQEEELEKADE
jgi:Predicted amidohydrolase